jgi:hypothetical protein
MSSIWTCGISALGALVKEVSAYVTDEATRRKTYLDFFLSYGRAYDAIENWSFLQHLKHYVETNLKGGQANSATGGE